MISLMTAHFTSLLLGTAVGDALGLPAEGLRPQRIRQRWKGVWRMRLCFGRGMISDDTDHAALTAECLVRHPDDVTGFTRALAREMRWWFLALPPGTGLATARACLKLWLGVNPARSGVFSAGNGPAMRAPVIGLFHAEDAAKRREFVSASTRLTHTDPKALAAALAVAECAAWIARAAPGASTDPLLATLHALSGEPAWQDALTEAAYGLRTGQTVAEYPAALGLSEGVSGYAFHSVPVAVYAWLRHRTDCRAALIAVIECGGDTDSTGALTAALCALEGGEAVVPREWLDRIADWPRSISSLRRLALACGRGTPPPRRLTWPFFLVRNLFQLAVVLGHGARRLIPI